MPPPQFKRCLSGLKAMIRVKDGAGCARNGTMEGGHKKRRQSAKAEVAALIKGA